MKFIFLFYKDQKMVENRTLLKRQKTSLKEPLITIITAVYNDVIFLEEAINSVLDQSYKNIEYIIIDGGSTDGSLEIIKKYSNNIEYWISEKDNGVYDAWNKGINKANGDWICFLGADDFLLPDAIHVYVNNLESCFDLDYVSSKVILCDKNKKKIKTIGQSWEWNSFSKFMTVAHVGSLHNKYLFKKYGLFDTRYKICGDYELLLRARDNLKTKFIDEETCFMRIGGISNSNLRVFKETFKAKKTHRTRNIFLLFLDLYKAFSKWTLDQVLMYFKLRFGGYTSQIK
jgi:glycosyltransferase involved in cell wall biosynthesis